MMKSLVPILFIFVFTTGFSQSDAVRVKHYNLKSMLALEGYDPVSYFDGAPLKGKSNLAHVEKGITYYFSNQANLSKFKANPSTYEPAYGGWCAYAMGANGEKVKVDPETFKIVGGKLYLFYNFWTNNTLEDWNKNEKKLKEAGDRNWNKIVK